jgi:hypothetical protein
MEGRNDGRKEAFMQEAGPSRASAATRWLLGLAVAALAVAQAGCLVVAAGAAAGAAATGYVYYKGKLYRDFPASIGDIQLATRSALVDLQFPLVTQEEKTGGVYFASKTTDGTPIRIWLEMVPSRVPADGTMTRVSVRVGAFGDEGVSIRILDQVAAHLVIPAPARPQAAAASPPAPPVIQPAGAVLPGETAPPPLAPTQPK